MHFKGKAPGGRPRAARRTRTTRLVSLVAILPRKTNPVKSQRAIDGLERAAALFDLAEQAKVAGNYSLFWTRRRRALLLQAEVVVGAADG